MTAGDLVCGSRAFTMALRPTVRGFVSFTMSLPQHPVAALVNGHVDFTMKLMQGVRGHLDFTLGLFDQAFYDMFIANPSGSSLGSGGAIQSGAGIVGTKAAGLRRYKNYAVKFEVIDTQGGISMDLTPYLESWDLDENRNNPSALTVTLANKNRDLRVWIDGHLNPVLDCNNMMVVTGLPTPNPYYLHVPVKLVAFKYIIRQRFKLTIIAGGTKTPYDFWFLTDTTWSPDFKSLQLQFNGITELLIAADGQYKDDYITSKSTAMTAKFACKDILTSYGILNFRFDFADFYIRHYSPKSGNALSWLRDIMYVRQLDWWLEGDVFVISDPRYSGPKGAYDWLLIDNVDCNGQGFHKTINQLKNQFVVTSVEKAGIILAEDEKSGGEALGYQEIPLESPAVLAMVNVVAVTHGKIDQFQFYSHGTPLLLSPSPICAAPNNQPIDKVSFIYTPEVGGAGGWPPNLTPHYHVIITGTYATTLNITVPGFDQRFWVLRDDPVSQDRYGFRSDDDAIANSIIIGHDDAVILTERLLFESSRSTLIGNITGPFHPLIKPAHSVGITATYQGLEDTLTWFIESKKSHGTATEANMTLEVTTIDA